MRFFYAPVIGSPFHVLDEEESRHVFKVLRLREGDEVLLTDGRGGRFAGALVATSRTSCTLATRALEPDPPPARTVTLAIAPPRSPDRWEWLLEKATEVGVTDIQPVLTARTEGFKERRDRWERILAAAMKQSQRCWLPRLHAPRSWEDFLAQAGSAQGLLAHCLPARAAVEKVHILQAVPSAGDVWVAIGPEGDFTPEEIDRGCATGAREVDLGPHRLRTETAGLVALLAVDWGGQAS